MADYALLHDPDRQRWLRFARPLTVYAVHRLDQVMPTLHEIEARVARDGLHAVGLLSYEAAPAFDPALTTRPAGNFPLLHFGLFTAPEAVALPPAVPAAMPDDWRPAFSPGAYARAVDQIRRAIAAGETYQVNLTFPLHSRFPGDPRALFCRLVRGQRAAWAGYLEAGSWAVCSASPELFFRRDGQRLLMRPMKGTARRAPTQAADLAVAAGLTVSAKDRAENLMILDMVRNDLGRIAAVGSVRVAELFAVEKYPTLWQMTSTASAESTVSLAEIFAALFPCASITGAPKARTMQLIAALEERPRDIYTGSFGWLAPDGNARFSVAIRTLLVDRQRQEATYGVGAGITWDSRSRSEYRECLAKGAILTRPQPEFALLATLRWAPGHGYFLLERHLDRLRASADYFERPWDEAAIRQHLRQLAEGFPGNLVQRVRLLLGDDGRPHSEATPLAVSKRPAPLCAVLARGPVEHRDPFLYHKTTHRVIYEQSLAAAGDADEVLLWNAAGEATEFCTGNLVAELDGRLVTPPLASGLLAGVYRAELLQRQVISEQKLPVDQLGRCRQLFLVNALRKWRRVALRDR
ncbi:MAG: aminodeoxychorismate synthase component I [Desulfuromonadales bacterium]|nr:aminodeoxychorismate synthase component I [Desulfuromonadales bacterium]